LNYVKSFSFHHDVGFEEKKRGSLGLVLEGLLHDFLDKLLMLKKIMGELSWVRAITFIV
jgi:hypothetical protein